MLIGHISGTPPSLIINWRNSYSVKCGLQYIISIVFGIVSNDREGLLLIQEVLQPLCCAFREEEFILFLQQLLCPSMYSLSTLRYLSFNLIYLIEVGFGLLALLENDGGYLNRFIPTTISRETRGLCIQNNEVLRIGPCLPCLEVMSVSTFFLFANWCQSLLARQIDGILCLAMP